MPFYIQKGPIMGGASGFASEPTSGMATPAARRAAPGRSMWPTSAGPSPTWPAPMSRGRLEGATGATAPTRPDRGGAQIGKEQKGIRRDAKRQMIISVISYHIIYSIVYYSI